MGTLPKGCKQENYIEINKPIIYYLPGFENLDDAQNRLNELYNNYSHQQAYTILATAEPTITGYAIRLPQEAITYLSPDEQKHVTPVLKSNTHPIHYTPMVYRFLKEKYIDSFFKDGSLMLSTYEKCKTLEDKKRRDEQEGINTFIKTEGKFKVVLKAGIGYNPLLLCTSLYQVDTTGEVTDSKFGLEIREPEKFAEIVAKELEKNGCYVIDTYIGPCYYSDKIIEGTGESTTIEVFLNETERNKAFDPRFFAQIMSEMGGNHIYFNKPLKFVHENEYRFTWIVNYDPKDKPVHIKVPDARQYCRKVCLK